MANSHLPLAFLAVACLLFANAALALPVNATSSFIGTPVTLPVNAATIAEPAGGNITNLNLNINSTTLHWQGFYGNVSGTIRLAYGGSALKEWQVATKSGLVYISTSPNVNFSALNSTAVSLSDVDNAFSFLSGADDSAASTGANNANPQLNISNYYLQGSARPAIFSRDSTGAASWEQVVLAQSGPSSKDDLVFAGMLRNASPAFNGALSDFQIVVPASGDSGSAGESYYFYGELG